MSNTGYIPRDKRRKRRNINIIRLVVFLAMAGLVFTYSSSHFGKDPDKIVQSIEKIVIPPTPVPTPDVGAALEAAWKGIISGRQGLVDIAVYNNTTKKTSHYSNTTITFNTASIVKLSILEALLIKDQGKGQPITAAQLANATPMIENSDNDAATDLWQTVGGSSAMDTFFDKVGAKNTTAAPQLYWGLTQTTALDQVAVVNALAYPGKIVSEDSALVANDLLRHVETDQKWGVSGGIPAGTTVLLKNGWLPDAETDDVYSNTNDWTVNSIGHVSNTTTDYTIAILTEGNPTEQYGIDTIESLSRATWGILDQ